MVKNQIIWTDAMVKDLIREIKVASAHIKTKNTQEEKFNSVFNALKDSRNFVDLILTPGAPLAKWKSITQSITKKYLDEEANLSGLEPPKKKYYYRKKKIN